MRLWERNHDTLEEDLQDFGRGFARICETLGENSQGFARLWESIHKDSHWERIHEDLQGFARIL